MVVGWQATMLLHTSGSVGTPCQIFSFGLGMIQYKSMLWYPYNFFSRLVKFRTICVHILWLGLCTLETLGERILSAVEGKL